MLPDSSYDDGNWRGHTIYEENNLNVWVEFGVYDMFDPENEFVWEADLTLPEEDQFVYAYELYNHGNADLTEAITSFAIRDIDGGEIDSLLVHNTTAMRYDVDPNTWTEGVDHDPSASMPGEWVWTLGNGYIAAGEHSWILVFSSDRAPVRGSFEITGAGPSEAPERTHPRC